MSVKVSIVTICFNNPEDLLFTIDSIDKQTELPFEHWIIDGSNNNSIKGLLENLPKKPYRKSIHEPDKGISDAFNKGIERCKGDYIHLLNSGDSFFNEKSLEYYLNFLNDHPDADWVHARYKQKSGKHWISTGEKLEPQKLYKGMMKVGHPTMMVSRKTYAEVGLYNIDLKYSMDYDMLIRLMNRNFFFIDKTLAYFAPGGVSSSQIKKAKKEKAQVYKKYFGNSISFQLYQIRLDFIRALLSTKFGNWLLKQKQKKNLISP